MSRDLDAQTNQRALRRECHMSLGPDRLADELERAVQVLRDSGEAAWQRADDWTTIGKAPTTEGRGGGLGDATPEQRIADRREDAQAARYLDELRTLADRMEADAHRLRRVIAICCPEKPIYVGKRDMLLAQVAADGWCVSCWRNDQKLNPIAKRPNGQPYYRDRCRACGEWKAESGEDPPLEVLKARHEGRRVRVKA